MTLHSPITLRSADNQLMVTGYTKKKPVFEFEPHTACPAGVDMDYYQRSLIESSKEISEWLASKTELPVSEGSKSEFDIIYKNKNTSDAGVTRFYDQPTTKSFDISELAGRIQVEYEKCCAIACDWPECKMPSCYGNKRITLLPEKKERQDQRVIWKEFFDHFWTHGIDDTMKQFTITKKK